MLFKDQAESLVARWENLRTEDDISLVAAQTAVALSEVCDVPEDVLDHLNKLMGFRFGRKQARAVFEVVKYLRTLCEEKRPKVVEIPLILRA